MNVQIQTSQLSQVASSIMCYVFNESRKILDAPSVEWLSEVSNFCRMLVDLSENVNDGEKYRMVEVPDKISKSITDMIADNIFKEIKDMVEDDSEWLFAMMFLYKQLEEEKEPYIGKNENDNASMEEQHLRQTEREQDKESDYSL